MNSLDKRVSLPQMNNNRFRVTPWEFCGFDILDREPQPSIRGRIISQTIMDVSMIIHRQSNTVRPGGTGE
jgi:hypothetical protein